MEEKNLQMSLKTKWFEMTKAGIKTEDYREINEYWCRRLLYKIPFNKSHWSAMKEILKGEYDCKGWIDFTGGAPIFEHFTVNTMTLGYPKSTDTERILKFEHAGIEIRTGNPEWGAKHDKLYFVIKHGKRIQ